MRLPIFQVDAFTSELFGGNPAAVVPLEEWPEDARLQAIAAENNLSETAYLVGEGSTYELRWFTPAAEVDLCGHATLASAWVVVERLRPDLEKVRFKTRSGILEVVRTAGGLRMDLPACPASPAHPPRALAEGLGIEPDEVLAAKRDYMAVLSDEESVRRLKPDFDRLRTLNRLGVIVTAPGSSCDFVSRFFAPILGVPEDPVTGSAHATLTPYWARRLDRSEPLRARQLSARGGELTCELSGDRVLISGRCVLYLEGTIYV